MKNVYLAMGFPADDAAVQAIRADLASAIAKHIRDLTQADAAQRLGLTQSVVSNIVRGNVLNVSVERFIRAMVRAGIPGCAEWPSADKARAGAYEPVTAALTVHSHIALQAQPLSFGDVFTVPSSGSQADA